MSFKEPIKVAKTIVFDWMSSPDHMGLMLLNHMIRHPDYEQATPIMKEAIAMFCGQVHAALRIAEKSPTFITFARNMLLDYEDYQAQKLKPRKQSIELDGVLRAITIRDNLITICCVRPDILTLPNIGKLMDCIKYDKLREFLTVGYVESDDEDVTIGFNITRLKRVTTNHV